MRTSLFFTISQAIIPILATLSLGCFSAWRRQFNTNDANTLIRLVMLYALPLTLFTSILSTPRTHILSSAPLAVLISLAMMGSYCVVFTFLRWVLKYQQGKSALVTLAVTGPSVPFIGIPVLGQLFGAASALPISISALIMNLIQVPLTIVLLNEDQQSTAEAPTTYQHSRWTKGKRLLKHFLHSCREPVVWAPLLALICMAVGIKLPLFLKSSFMLVGHITGGAALFASGIVLFTRQAQLSALVGGIITVRNILIPLTIYGIAQLWHLPTLLIKESVVTMAMPSAAVSVILAMRYHILEREVASVLFFGTLSSLLTIASFIWLTHI